ncbi:hypothetical protein, partial [Weizmannia sp. CD-2023]|nr:hypothetical protein [Weizmannia sp. CD-2023]
AVGAAAKVAAVLPEAAAQAGDGNAKHSKRFPFLNGREARFKPLGKSPDSPCKNKNGKSSRIKHPAAFFAWLLRFRDVQFVPAAIEQAVQLIDRCNLFGCPSDISRILVCGRTVLCICNTGRVPPRFIKRLLSSFQLMVF